MEDPESSSTIGRLGKKLTSLRINNKAKNQRKKQPIDELQLAVAEKKDLSYFINPKNIWSRYRRRKSQTKKLLHSRSHSHVQWSRDCYMPTAPPTAPLVSKLVGGLENKITMVWLFLKLDDYPKIIGVHGLAGVGKTTLLKAIHGKLLMKKNSCDFDVVVWVGGVPAAGSSSSSSSSSSIGNIQGQILRGFGYSDHQWKSISQEERRRCIYQNLSTSNFVLLFDDVFPLDFSEIGVPIHLLVSQKSSICSHNTSKVVFTTRSSSTTIYNCFLYDGGVISNSDLKTVELNRLSQAEGYQLFVRTVGESCLSSHPDIPQLARRIVELCYGLPLPIITFGRYLAGRRAEHTLNEYMSRNITTDPNNSLFHVWKFYFDVLEKSETKRSMFIECSLFLQNRVLNCDQLLDYSVGEKLHDNLSHSSIGYFKHIGLLLGEGNSVQTHTRIHEFALWMSANNGWFDDNYLVHAGEGLTEVPLSAEWKEATKISLVDNQIEQLSEPPECPNLSTLILSKNPLKKIEDGFFQFMPSLRVLDISWCMMGEIPKDIVSLVSLEYLNLSHTDIARLPIEFMNLKKLRVLDLSYMSELYALHREVLVSLESLQALNTFHSCPSTKLMVEGSELLVGSKEFVEELHRLNGLKHVGISIRDAQALGVVKPDAALLKVIHSVQFLSCEDLTTLHLSDLRLIWYLKTLEINDCEELEQIEFKSWIAHPRIPAVSLENLRYSNFNNLLYVKIERCWSLKELTWIFFIPNLQELYIERCMNLKVVIDDHPMIQPTMSHSLRLKNICLRTLPALTCISNIGISLPWLEEITVSYCPGLKKFPIEPISYDKHLKSIRGSKKWWDDLEWEDESIKNYFRPYFEEIKS